MMGKSLGTGGMILAGGFGGGVANTLTGGNFIEIVPLILYFWCLVLLLYWRIQVANATFLLNIFNGDSNLYLFLGL
jgi:hypothetical protein